MKIPGLYRSRARRDNQLYLVIREIERYRKDGFICVYFDFKTLKEVIFIVPNEQWFEEVDLS